MKKQFLSISFVIIAVITITFFATQLKKENGKIEIAIVSIVEIEPITLLRKGFIEELENSSYSKNHDISFTEFNAQGESGLINQIADKVISDKPDLVYVLGTPVAQAIQNRDDSVLIVQGAVTDPVEAGLSDSWTGSGRNYIATSDLPPVDIQISIINSLVTNLKTIGVIYNPGESNSVAVITRIRSYIKETNLGIKLFETPISTTNDIPLALQSLLGRVEAIYLPPDNTAHSGIPLIGRFSNENKIPFFATVESALKEGAVITFSLDFLQLGKETAILALEVLNGKDPSKIPIKLNSKPSIFLNKSVATSLELNVVSLEQFQNVILK